MKLGADLSYHQGQIDWSKVKLDFVILREGYRQTTDTRFFEYVKGCTKVGIPILGVYHFSYALNADQAKQEAVLAVKNVQKAGLSKDTIIFFDFEYDTVQKAKKAGVTLGKKQCMEHTKVFCEEVTRLGYRAGIYANQDYYKNYYDKSLIDKYIFWLAHYTTGKPAYPCYLCQFTNVGKVNGISGDVDLNHLYGVPEEIKTGNRTRSRLLDQARSWLGLKESDGSFKTIIDTYNSHTPLARGYKLTYKDSWCSAFVSACAIKTGMTDIIPTECGCERHIELFKKLGVWVEKDNYIPDPADIIFYDWDDVEKSGDTVGYADHVGIVESCDGKNITVIEGNKNDAVGRRTIPVGAKTIRGFAVPRYDVEEKGGEPVGFQCINYLKRTGDSAEKVFKKVVEIKCKHSPIASWDEMVKTRSISCSSSGSVALQLAGCLDVGKKIGHVSTKDVSYSSIKKIDDAMYGRNLLKHCRVIWTNCKYKDLPHWLRQRGVVYIQWSNCCTSAGDGWVWSTNEEGGYHRQSDGSMRYDQYKETKNRSGVLSNGGHYPWGGQIFCCIVPDEKWNQHFAVEVMLEKHGKKETRQDHFGSHYDDIQKMVDKMCRDHFYFCKWSADYILEGYGTINDFYKAGHFDYRSEVQEMVNDIKKYAHEVWSGKHGDLEQRKKDFPDLWEQIQKQVNRTVS